MNSDLSQNQQQVLKNCSLFVKNELLTAEGGHDWQHIKRVCLNADKIIATEKADRFLVQLGCLLHDIADAKFHQGNEEIGPQKAKNFLHQQQVDEKSIDEINFLIRNISYRSSFNKNEGEKSMVFKIVQDADRLDAIGAIGIARTFNYGGFKNRLIYDPEIQPNLHQRKSDYLKSKSPTINHFYEKLLHLKDLMNTKTGKKMAQERHQFMLDYLAQFYKECGSPNWL
ncbi:MAG: HD domain-containing protein [Bacteroidota bacterium]